MAVITIIGAGMMGSAMSIPARDNGHQVRLVGTHLDTEIINALQETGMHPKLRRTLPEQIQYYPIDGVETALLGAELVICGVSSFGVEWFGSQMLPKIPQGVPLLSITKGLELLPSHTLRPFPEVFEHMLPSDRGISCNAVGGPCTSYELADRHQTHVVYCGRDIAILQRIRALMQTPYYHISLSTDITGVEIAVALKNAYALGVSLAIGLAEQSEGIGCVPHYNAQAALFSQSVREMCGLLALLGGKPENICYGAGDLYVTIFGGRTRLLGTLLGRGLSFPKAMQELSGVTLESVAIASRIAQAVRTMAAKGQTNLNAYPLLIHIDEIINGDAQVNIPWEKFTINA